MARGEEEEGAVARLRDGGGAAVGVVRGEGLSSVGVGGGDGANAGEGPGKAGAAGETGEWDGGPECTVGLGDGRARGCEDQEVDCADNKGEGYCCWGIAKDRSPICS